GYLWQLRLCLKYRAITATVFLILIVGTMLLLPASPGKEIFAKLGWVDDYKGLGSEFMPEVEEGNLWIRCTGPLNQTLERNVEIARQARAIMATYPEVEAIVSQSGRPDDGTDTAGYFNTEYFVPLRPQKGWPDVRPRGT